MTEGVCDTLTIRLIRSFEYRTHKNLILKNVPKSLSLMALKHIIADRITQDSSFKVYRNTPFDTFKIFTKPHGSKVCSPVYPRCDFTNVFISDIEPYYQSRS